MCMYKLAVILPLFLASLGSVSTNDSTVDSFAIETRVETASGARLDLHGNVKRNPTLDWTTELFYTGKDPVAKVLTLAVTPLQPNQVKVFSAAEDN